MVVVSMMASGHVAMWTILAVGLFNSLMFPTIFTLAIEGLGKHSGQASGILCTAIVGGAIANAVTLVDGVVANVYDLEDSAQQTVGVLR
jgi:FHS family L-fucose permease-like MFS transporter